MTTVSVITPTIGRESLRTMLVALIPQLSEGDEALVVGDGPQPAARTIVESLACPLIKYWESEPLFNWGNPQRNQAVARAQGQRLIFIDDDDCPLPGGIAAVKAAGQEAPERPLMFRMDHGAQTLWRSKTVVLANVSGQMFVPPNIKGRLGLWSTLYEADYDFILSTLALYPEGAASVVWRDEKITRQGYVGPTAPR